MTAIAFAGGGLDLVSGSADGSVIVARDGHADLALPRAAGGIDAVAILQDGRILAADARQRLRVYAPDGITHSPTSPSRRGWGCCARRRTTVAS